MEQPTLPERNSPSSSPRCRHNPPWKHYLAFAQSFNDWRNFSTALRFLELARKAYPQNPEPARLMGETLLADNQLDKAVVAFDEALTLRPRDIGALLGKARIYAATSRLAEAEPVYRRAVAEQPDSHPALTGLAAILARQHNWAGAVDAYRSANTAESG